MRAITLFPVFAELVAAGRKRLENRTRPTAYRGPLAIHASLRSHYNGEPIDAWARLHEVDVASLRPGHLLAVVDLVDCVRIGEIARRIDAGELALDQSVHAIGPWCYVLANARRIEPVPAVGQLGLWRLLEPARAV